MQDAQIIGVGPTDELSLRVSVATLARVVFPHPDDGQLMLALEHQATVVPVEKPSGVVVKAQPFGGAARIFNLDLLKTQIGRFHFDSEKSRAERDFRIFIHPEQWASVQAFWLAEMGQDRSGAIEVEPSRELAEEFKGTLGIHLRPDQFVCTPIRSVLENEPVRTGNVFSFGSPTVRIYRIFVVAVGDVSLGQAILANSASHSANTLRELALEDARNGGRGWANAILVAPLEKVRQAFLARPAEAAERPLPFENTILDENVSAVLDGIKVPKYLVV